MFVTAITGSLSVTSTSESESEKTLQQLEYSIESFLETVRLLFICLQHWLKEKWSLVTNRFTELVKINSHYDENVFRTLAGCFISGGGWAQVNIISSWSSPWITMVSIYICVSVAAFVVTRYGCCGVHFLHAFNFHGERSEQSERGRAMRGRASFDFFVILIARM